jgi:quercetin dioxygenase-like cupin family protein
VPDHAKPGPQHISAGPVIENPISGERIVIRESGEDNGGELLSFDLFLPPGTHVPAGHVHPKQEERFTIVAGQMRFRVGRRVVLANPGDTVRVTAGSEHWFGNDGAETAHARVEVRPALRMEELLRATAALGEAGHIPGTRFPLPSRLAVVLLDFQRELAIPHVPALLTRIALAPLAWLGRRNNPAGRTPAGR